MVNRHYDAIVIGGGAAGLMTAWQAGLRGRSVVVLERSKQAGRKILMSGGGRCNFTNLHITADNFLSSNPHFVKSAISQYTAWDFISKVQEHGIAWHERSHGQLFCDDKAKDILNLLLSECAAVNVDILTTCDIETVTYRDNFTVKTSKGLFVSPSVVVATGGLSIPKMGTTPFGYEIARQFNMSVLPIRASLVPYTFTGTLKAMFARLSGVSVDATLTAGNQKFTEAVLFTHRGLSGPAALQISNYWTPGDSIRVDLLPQESVAELLSTAKRLQPKSLVRSLLNLKLPKSLVTELETLWWSDLKDTPVGDWRNARLSELAENVNNWEVVPAGTEGYRTAEVTFGGVNTDNLSSKTMESSTQAGLYFVGEVVDVTGHLGGFNFQWAWSSAYVCAQAL